MSTVSSTLMLLVLINTATSFMPFNFKSVQRLNAVTLNPTMSEYVETIAGSATESLISEEMVTDDQSASELADR
jgi:hypothetical protein